MKRLLTQTNVWLTMAAIGLGVAVFALPPLQAQITAPADGAIAVDPLFSGQPATGRPATATTPATEAAPLTDSLDAPRRDHASNDPFAGPQRVWIDELGETTAGRRAPRENLPAEANARRVQDQIRRAVAAIRDAPNEAQKSRETKILNDLLNEYFETDTRRREAELAQIEERVNKLREQLDLRRQKKQEIIDLQMKVALNEADGLGFFSSPSDSQSRYAPFLQAIEPQPALAMPPGSRDIPLPPAPATPPAGRTERRNRDSSDRNQPATADPSPLDDLFGPSTQPTPVSPPIR
jgi:hypothetical protein